MDIRNRDGKLVGTIGHNVIKVDGEYKTDPVLPFNATAYDRDGKPAAGSSFTTKSAARRWLHAMAREAV